MEYDRAEAIEQTQATSFIWTRTYEFGVSHEWEVNQATDGRNLNKLSSNTLEDLPIVPTLMIFDSRATSPMQPSIDSTKKTCWLKVIFMFTNFHLKLRLQVLAINVQPFCD